MAKLTRADGEDFLRVAASLPLQVSARPYPLDQANQALDDLRAGRFTGAAVLLPSDGIDTGRPGQAPLADGP